MKDTIGRRKQFARLADRAITVGVLKEYQVQSRMPGYRITLYLPTRSIVCQGFPDANNALELLLAGYTVGRMKGTA